MIRRLRYWLARFLFSIVVKLDPDDDELIAASIEDGAKYLWIGNGMVCVGVVVTDKTTEAIEYLLRAENWEIEALSEGREP